MSNPAILAALSWLLISIIIMFKFFVCRFFFVASEKP